MLKFNFGKLFVLYTMNAMMENYFFQKMLFSYNPEIFSNRNIPKHYYYK